MHPSSSSDPGMEQLLALAHPTDTCRGMFFNGLLDAARSLGGEPLRARCFTVMGERKFVDFFSYPITDFLRSIFLVAEELGPTHGGTEAVLRLLGRRATTDFAQSTVGKTLLALAGNDPGRVLAAVPNGCRASLSYGERSVEVLGEGHARFLARGDLLPRPYNEGMIAAAVELSSARDVQVRGERRGVLDIDYEVRWS